MKRSEMVLKITKAHTMRYVLVESKHITLQVFMDEMIEYIEHLGMLPPLTLVGKFNVDGGVVDKYDNAWDKE